MLECIAAGAGLATVGIDGMVGFRVPSTDERASPSAASCSGSSSGSGSSTSRGSGDGGDESKTDSEVDPAFGRCPLLRAGIQTVLAQVHPDHEMHSDVVEAMVAMAWLYLEAVASKAADAARLGAAVGASVGVVQVQDAVRQVLPSELAKHAVSEGAKAVKKFESNSDEQGTDGSKAAGLTFPISTTQTHLEAIFKRSTSTTTSIDTLAGVYVTATMEYMAAEVLELSGNAASNEGHESITVEHIEKGFDEELSTAYLETLGFDHEPFMNGKAQAEAKVATAVAVASASASASTLALPKAEAVVKAGAETVARGEATELTQSVPGARWLVYPAPTLTTTDLVCVGVAAVVIIQALTRGIMARRHHDKNFGIDGIELSAEVLVGIADDTLKSGVRLIKGHLAGSTDHAATPPSLSTSRRVQIACQQGQSDGQAQASTRSLTTIGLQRERMWSHASTDKADGIIVGGALLKMNRADFTPKLKDVFMAGARHRLGECGEQSGVIARPFVAVK